MAPTSRIILGVAGGIAAYKACELLRRLTESGHRVRVVPTESALRFVGTATWAALSGEPVTADVWAGAHDVPHVRLGREADLVVVAPATADLLARAAIGRADDLLTATLLTARCPVLLAPAMHTEMWQHPATVTNVATLRERGAVVLDPAAGRLTGADSGPGRLPEPAEIAAVVEHLLRRGAAAPDLAGMRVVVTAGGTREHLDPVRFLGNDSSGRQGYAIAAAAAARGASVTLIAANVALPAPAGVHVVPVVSTAQLRGAVVTAADGAGVVVIAAAPADFGPRTYSPAKIKKAVGAAAALELTRTPDIAAQIGAGKPRGQVLVIFAAETEDGPANARAKLAAKNADAVVLNDVSGGRVFGSDRTTASIIGADGAGSVAELIDVSKAELADALWDWVASRRAGTIPPPPT
ncbi:MAG: bifunctional phosphopantothenoylcysteine decarboxylase/phosphopantothenate--cysteine ligase CoaBC [Mycobacteriales bacterium]